MPRREAYELLIRSEAGLLSVTGTPEQPARAGPSIANVAAGMYAYGGILAALLPRGRTGRGSRVEVSLVEALGERMGLPLHYTSEGAPPRDGRHHASRQRERLLDGTDNAAPCAAQMT